MLLLLACTATTDKDPASTATDTATLDTTTPYAGLSLGDVCPVTTRSGEIAVFTDGGAPQLVGTIYDGPDPWIGPAEIENDTCAFHHFSTDSCGACDPGETCGFSGQCVPQRHARIDLSLDVEIRGVIETFTSDPVTGMVSGPVGDADDIFTFTLRYGGTVLQIPPIALASFVNEVRVAAAGDPMSPGDLEATWSPAYDGQRVRSEIAINHQAAGPTFTRCDVVASTGAFYADAAMLAPLAVVTGLEFPATEVARTATVITDDGCIDFRVGTRRDVSVDWGG